MDNKIVDRVKGLEIGQHILVKNNNKKKIRYGIIYDMHPERRFCVARIIGNFGCSYTECFVNEEVVALSEEDALEGLRTFFQNHDLDFNWQENKGLC